MSGLPKNIRPGERAGEFIITPDAGKWYLVVAGAVLFGLVTSSVNGDSFAWVVAAGVIAFAIGMARGKLAWIRVGRDGLEYLHIFRRKHYRWEDVTEFTNKSVGFGANQQHMIMFSLVHETGLMSKVSKFMAGGTESMPVIGLSGDQLVRILNKARAEYADPRASAHDPIVSRGNGPVPETRRAYVPGSKPQTVTLSPPVAEAPRIVRAPEGRPSAMARPDPIDKRQKPLIS